MFDKIFSQRGLLVTVIACVFIVGGTSWWSCVDLARFKESLRPLSAPNGEQQPPSKKTAIEDVQTTEPSDVVQTEKPIKKQGIGTESTVSTDTPPSDKAAAQRDQNGGLTGEAEKEIPVSPHGLGPFPEVSEEYFHAVEIPPWKLTELYGAPPVSRNQELMARVMVKLWNEGHTTVEGLL